MPRISRRLDIFHIVFSQFTILQIIKSTYNNNSQSTILSTLLLTILVVSFCGIQFFFPRSNSQVVLPICMYSSFILLSIIDGSLSNHVVTSSSLASLILSCHDHHRPHVWKLRAEDAVKFFCAILYLVTGIHKLNDGFFDPRYTCASLYVSGSLSWVPSKLLTHPVIHQIGSLLIQYAPLVAVMFELGMAMFLILSIFIDTEKKMITRTILFVGALFHAILALPPSPLSVYPFSSIMVPMYILLVPEECDGIEKFFNFLTKTRIAILIVVSAMIAQNASKFIFGEEDLFEYPNYGLWGVSVLWNSIAWLVVLFSLSFYSSTQNNVEKQRSLGMRYSTRLILLGLFVFGLTPYIGLRNYPALAMFSNLRTEGSYPNHWLPSWDLFGYQTDYVEIVSTNIQSVRNIEVDLGKMFPKKLKETNDLFGLSSEFYICPPKWPYEVPEIEDEIFFSVPWVELRRRMSSLKIDALEDDAYVEYIRHRPGKADSHYILQKSELDQESEVLRPLGFFETGFVKFRSFSNRYSPCRH